MLKSIFYLNELGRRKDLEDSIYPAPGQASLRDTLFLVCDGVGGENKGEEASRIVCEAIPQYAAAHRNQLNRSGFFQAAVDYTIVCFREYAASHPEAARMASTLTLISLDRDAIHVAWCGDSRIYHLRGGKTVWKSGDHSMVMELVRQNELTEAEAAHHPGKNMILRSLSAAEEGNHHIEEHTIRDFRRGDYLLLCTDGVLENVDEAVLEDILGRSQTESDIRRLFREACEEKTKDNYSLYLLELDQDVRKPRRAARTIGLTIAGVAVLALVVAFAFFGPVRSADNPATPAASASPAVPRSAAPDSHATAPREKTRDSGLLNILNKTVKKSTNPTSTNPK